MKQEYVNPFLEPAMLVWKSELGETLELDSVTAVSRKYTTEDITVAIGVSGRLQDIVLYGFPAEAARAVVDLMLGEEYEVNSELALSAFGELANMVTGNAATELSGMGYRCEINPPVIIESAGTVISTLGRPQLLVKFESEVGPLHTRISLAEGVT
jgi:chemotaxis protein CheX